MPNVQPMTDAYDVAATRFSRSRTTTLAECVPLLDVALEFIDRGPAEVATADRRPPDTDLPEARAEMEKYFKLGARGIGEQKFGVDCDSVYIGQVAELAQDYGVPVLLHFQHEMYNLHIERFHKILEKFPKVNFIGHAQTWWANIDKNHADQTVLYPKGKVTPGGITDRLLSDYPNMFGDCSAGSGLNALTRDEEFTPAFLKRHQNKLVFGSDCEDAMGSGPKCQGAQIIAAIRRFAPGKAIERKILYENAKKLLKL